MSTSSHTPGKILVTTRSFRKVPGRHQQLLLDAGYEIVNSPEARPLKADELGALLADPKIVGAILGVDEVAAAAIEPAQALRVISRFGVGVDNVDLAAATAHGIVVTNTPGANSIAVAELTIALILALARHVARHDRAIRKGDWSVISGMELHGQTLGIVGLGRIGQETAQRAAAFGMRIQFYDPLPPSPEVVAALNATACTLDKLLTDSDVVSLHLPLMDETRNLIDADAIARMKAGALLINTARGGLVDESALYDALAQNKLGGAAFDAFAKEPSIGNPLLELENFIAAPHSGSATKQTTLRMGLMAAENALAVLRGERPLHVVNPEVYEA
ncbi:MAG: phosphoglycerate dehydrogenase [Anaerolineae bacterium]|nr:phosphoglycerate dehydrogenase [Anaerolineae bacterium]